MKIGIITFHRAHNYGAVLQCYALQEVLKEMGHNTYVIDYYQLTTERCYKVFRWRAFRGNLIHPRGMYQYITKLLQKSEMRKNMVMDLIYRGFIYAANYSESHYNPRRSQIKTELRYLFVTTLNR